MAQTPLILSALDEDLFDKFIQAEDLLVMLTKVITVRNKLEKNCQPEKNS